MMEWPLIYYKFEGPESKDYRPVEYIGCTGTQYILTDIIPKNNYKYEMEYQITNTTQVDSAYRSLFGTLEFENGSVIARVGMNFGDPFTSYVISPYLANNTFAGTPYSSSVATTKNKVILARPKSKFNQIEITMPGSAELTEPTIPLVIFGDNRKEDSADAYVSPYKITANFLVYSFKIYDINDVLIHSLIPVERQSDGELGLYDKITDMFYTNSGTGTFTKGDYLDEGEGFFYCSDKKIDNTFNCWCNYDSNNNIINHFYTSIYNGCIINNKMRSLSGISLEPNNGYGNTTGQQEVNASIANDTTADVEWYTDVISDRLLISALLILISKNLNNKVAFGRGLDSSGESTHHDQYTTGTLNNKGLFWGDTSTGTQGVKVFGMEGWYACRYRRIAGLVSIPKNNIMYYGYKLTYGTVDGSAVSSYNSTGNGYLLTDFPTPTASSTMFVKQMNFGRHGFLPSVLDNNSIISQYYATAFYPYTNVYAITSGSSVNASGDTGSMYFGFGTAFNDTNQYVGTGLSCKPILRNNG